MISRVRLFESTMIGPSGSLPGEMAALETTTIPPRRPGLKCDITASAIGVLVIWKAAGQTGENLLPWANVRDVAGTAILGKAADERPPSKTPPRVRT